MFSSSSVATAPKGSALDRYRARARMEDKREPLLSSAGEELQPGSNARRFGLWPFADINHNVVVACIVGFLSPAADAVWQGTVLTTYMYLQYSSSNAAVGYADGVKGGFMLLIAMPIGWAADRWSNKSGLVRVGACAVPFALGLTAAATVGHTEAYSYPLLVISLCVWGGVYAICKGPVQAILASSTRQGERSRYYTLKFQLTNIAAALGRLVTIGIFAARGNHWDLSGLRLLIHVGLGLELLSACAMLCFRDRSLVPAAMPSREQPSPPADGVSRGTGGNESGAPPSRSPHPQAWLVPGTLFVASIFFALGSGMTVKFFPLFFAADLRLSPVVVQLIFVAMPAVIAATSSLGWRMARCIGRIETILLLKSLSILMLVAIGLIGAALRGGWLVCVDQVSRTALVALVVVLFLVRSGLANCTEPLSTSISMDFVPSSARARWASLSIVVQACWSSSAMVGGLLADRFGYAFAFLLTAGFHVVGTLLQATLISIVPREE